MFPLFGFLQLQSLWAWASSYIPFHFWGLGPCIWFGIFHSFWTFFTTMFSDKASAWHSLCTWLPSTITPSCYLPFSFPLQCCCDFSLVCAWIGLLGRFPFRMVWDEQTQFSVRKLSALPCHCCGPTLQTLQVEPHFPVTLRSVLLPGSAGLPGWLRG